MKWTLLMSCLLFAGGAAAQKGLSPTLSGGYTELDGIVEFALDLTFPAFITGPGRLAGRCRAASYYWHDSH